jgi:hypothetical protein
MRKIIHSSITAAAAAAALLAAPDAQANSTAYHGVAFVHGTGDQTGSQGCSGSGTGWSCTVPSAVSGYWTQAEIDSVRGGRPYAVTGHHGGSMTPWANASPYKNSGSETTTGTAYEVAAQLARFVRGPDNVLGTADDITDLVVITHSGGSNVMRYILQHPTVNGDFTVVANASRKVITAAGVHKGTYLADRVFANDGSLLTLAGSALAGLMGFKDDGTYFIQTSAMTAQNADNAKLGNSSAWNSSTQGGKPFYSTGGLSTTKCFGVTVFGHCLGITAGSLGGSNCDSFLMDTGLAALHNAFLNANDPGTARNNCSDGFISCASSQALGTQFGFSVNQDHNQSRRKCNGEDSKIAAQVANAGARDGSAFENGAYSTADVPVKQWDSCQFHTPGTLKSGTTTVGYAAGCQAADLGDGWCDWDCVAMYGHDAPATWSGTAGASLVTSWGATDDCTGTTASYGQYYSTQAGGWVATADGYGFSSSNNPWVDYQRYSTDNVNWTRTAFTGKVHNGYTTQWYVDAADDAASPIATHVGNCPQSWIGDGTCDECVLALYGNDGNDCLPGKVTQCAGIATQYSPLSVTGNDIYNEMDSAGNFYAWSSVSSAAVGNGICDIGECTRNNWSPCSVDADCSAGTCSGGYCSDSASTCNGNGDCTSGTCANGGCTTASADCSTTTSAGVTISLCR